MKESGKKHKLFIILDGNSIMHRSFHALPPLSTRDGELVNAVFGFCSILMTILTQEEPYYIAATFDTAAPTFRHEMYTKYKAGRQKAPQEFYDQIPRIKQVVNTLSIPSFEKEGVEADDIIGTVVTLNEKNHPEMHNKIITSDNDAMQLVSNRTCVSTLHKGYKSTECFFPKDVYAKYGLMPDQIVDLKALMGDASDNIPGIKGIGKVGATKLLQTYKTLDGIYEHIERITGKNKQLLLQQKNEAYFSQKLATIVTDVEMDYELEKCKAHDFDTEKIIQLLESLQFYSLIRRLREWQKTHGIKASEVASVFDATQNQSKAKPSPNPNQSSLF